MKNSLGKTMIISFLMLTTEISAQTFKWAESFGGTSNDYGRCITVDTSGNVYTAGYFQGTADFDPGAGTTNLTALGTYDAFVQKMDASGNFLWAKSFGGIGNARGISISIDVSGNVYTTGEFGYIVDFDPGAVTVNLTSAGGTDIFVQKLDASGNFVWAKRFGGTSSEGGQSITVDTSGNVYTTGFFQGTADFDPGAGAFNLTAVGTDIFIQKMDTSGNFLWAKSFGGTSSEEGNSINIDVSGSVYTTGFFQGTADFDPGAGTTNLTAVGAEDIFVQKLDSSGNFVWAKKFGGASTDVGQSLIVDASGNAYTTGYFHGTVDFDPGAATVYLTSAGGTDIFIQKLDSSGNFVWAKRFGNTSSDQGNSIGIDVSGNVYTTGEFRGLVDFDPGAGAFNLVPQGNQDIFIQTMDASGNFLWAKSFGGNSNEEGASIHIDASGNIYTTGWFQGTADFDPGAGTTNLTAAGGNEIFVQKLSQCISTTGIAFITACNSYIWIDGNTYTTSNNTAKDTLINASGCDSVVTLNLTINHSNTGVAVITACNSYTWIDGITYTSSNNMAKDTLTNAAGCDSVVALNLTINSVSDISTSQNGSTITASNTIATYQWLDCNNSYAVIGGETNQSYTPTSNGNYAVMLTENSCTDTSACVNITNVGINEGRKNISVTVYPNPTTETFFVVFGQTTENVELTLTDILGKVISFQTFDCLSNTNIELKGTKSGLYFLNIKTVEGQKIIKLAKE